VTPDAAELRLHYKHVFVYSDAWATGGGRVAGREGGFSGRTTAAEYRRIAAETYYETERLMDEERGFWGESPVVYDAERDVYWFGDDGAFAFGRETINERELVRRGLWEGPTSQEIARGSRGTGGPG
jgi:hypothetical protein